MTQAAALLRRGCAAHAAQFPATITIDGETYTVGTSGEKRERDMMSGGWLKKANIAFWLPLSAFAAATKPVPAERSLVTLDTLAGVASGATYVIASTSTDATNTTITLKCETPEQ